MIGHRFVSDNLPDCFAIIERTQQTESLERLRSRSRDELYKEHFGCGLFLRNRFIYPHKSPLRAKIEMLPLLFFHPDSCGSFLLEALWLHLNGENGPQATLGILMATWNGLVEVAPQFCEPDNLATYLESLQDDKPRIEDVLPLFESRK